MNLQKRLEELSKELEATRAKFFQLQGAIAIVNEQMTQTQAPSEVKETETDGAEK